MLFCAAVAESLPLIVGRYAIFDEIASGGMATVHLGRLLGAAGFSRTVAIKRLHRHFAKDPDFVDMFVDEARLAARIRHPNVVPTLDVVQTEGELFLVMEYVQGASLSHLIRMAGRSGNPLDMGMVVAVVTGVLHGLHAAHQARGERGEPLAIVHRDVSPQNVLVGIDGVSRVFDFGVAKARGRLQTTREGQIKGKLAYMAPEQLRGEEVGPETDVYAAGAVLWEALAGRRLFDAETEVALLKQVLDANVHPPSTARDQVPESLDTIVMRALSVDRGDRFASAREMAHALESTELAATTTELAEWVEDQASATLQDRAARVAEIESQSQILELPDVDAIPSRRASLSGEESLPQPSTGAGVVRTADAHRSAARWRWPAAIALLLAGGGAAAVVLSTGDTDSDAASSAASGAAPEERHGAPSPEDGAGTERSAPQNDDGAGGTSAPASSASATAASSASASSAPAPIPPPPAVAPPKPAWRPPPPKTNPCADPFFVDASGIKRIKPECR